MGDNDEASNEKPTHKVTFTYDFYMGKYETTFDEYDAFRSATGENKPKDQHWGRGTRPVINVSWKDAIAYCNWLSDKEKLPKAYDSNGNLLDKDGRVTIGQKQSGNTQPVAVTRVRDTSIQVAITLVTSPGTKTIQGARLRKWERKHPTSWVYTICLEMYGSGAATGMEITPVRRRRIRIATVVPPGSCVGVAGTTTPRSHVWRIAAAPRPLSRTTPWGSVFAGRCLMKEKTGRLLPRTTPSLQTGQLLEQHR